VAGPGDGAPPTTVLSVEHMLERWRLRRDEIRVVTGHFPLCTTELLDAPFTTLTLLRDPVERTLSYLRHHREMTPSEGERPLEEMPQTAPACYLLLTHWPSAGAVRAYLRSPAHADLGDLGEVSSELFIPIAEEAGARPGLRADGLQRDWTHETGPWKSLRSPVPAGEGRRQDKEGGLWE